MYIFCFHRLLFTTGSLTVPQAGSLNVHNKYHSPFMKRKDCEPFIKKKKMGMKHQYSTSMNSSTRSGVTLHQGLFCPLMTFAYQHLNVLGSFMSSKIVERCLSFPSCKERIWRTGREGVSISLRADTRVYLKSLSEAARWEQANG